MSTKNLMTAKYLSKLYKEIESLGITIWIDGGWAVDALLGKETRDHSDLDIALEYIHIESARNLFESKGYKNVPRDDTTKWNFVMADDDGHQIDFHSFIKNESGDVVDGVKYPKESLTGNGEIDGQEVKCISPKYMIEFLAPWIHKWPEKYVPAISALCERFKIELPEEYNDWNSIGLKRGTVKVMPHNKAWTRLFDKEARDLKEWLGATVLDIQHVGSTSVPGLNAKPIIDMLMGVRSLGEVSNMRSVLEEHGYTYRENGSDENKELFVKGSEDKRTHHLHIKVYESPSWHIDIKFRDFLLNNPDSVEDYNKLKSNLAVKHADDRGKYTETKADFIQNIIKQAES